MESEPPQYRKVLADNLAAERTRKRLTARVLAERMAAYGYTSWVRQTVSEIELYRREIKAVEILGLATALGVPVTRLIYPPDDVPEVALPGGEVVIPDARPPRPLRWLRETGDVVIVKEEP
jgi:transcriptional regulator with XRE-family HTH domain